ncbi:MAG TPA: glycosyltransferase [Blastocatellia bacterium]|nr:glycosyltransferase [Blastocatellia bacterium]
MKILHVIPAVAARYGGPSHAVFEMCKALNQQGTEILIATTDADGESTLPVKLATKTEYNGQNAIFFHRQWSEAYKYSRPLANWLDANIKGFDAAHIHAVFSHSCLAAAKAARENGIPYIIRPLGTLDPWSLQQKRIRKQIMWRAGVGKMLRKASAIHYTATDEKDLAEGALGLNKGVVIPLGIDSDYFQSTNNDGIFLRSHEELEQSPYILALCRIHPKKGLELLIDAFRKLHSDSKFNSWRLVIAGNGEESYVRSIKELASNNGGSGSVIFSGWLSGAEKKSAIQNAALLALPSHQENFGICVAEAMACGVPVLVSPHVNLAKDIRESDSGWIAPLEETEFTSILREAMSNESERNRRGILGKQFASQQFRWSTLALRLNTLYQAVTSGGPIG